MNAVRLVEQEGREPLRYYDCGGNERHSLPLKDGKEHIYPVLVNLLNQIQEKTGKRVVITCGHRCPQHNTYSDPSPFNRNSKHMIGAEVDFYVEGMEDEPMTIIALIQEIHNEEFQRYKGNSNVSIPPWFNKEIFIKLYQRNEGRDFDNRHPYPYIGVQVRHDGDTQVSYSWEQAENYLRR